MSLIVVGQGMLGRAVLRQSSPHERFAMNPVEWSDPPLARRQLAEAATSFGQSIDGPWRLAWCAGAGVVGTSETHFIDEHSFLETFLVALRAAAPVDAATVGGLFFASSAGGVFGLGSSECLTEQSSESPISPYGQAKLAQERLVDEWAAGFPVPVLIGRISNLYGPDQNLAKAQGFISQLLRSMLIKRPFRLGVSGDTERDFIHVDDAAARIQVWLRLQSDGGVIRKLIAAGQSHTLLRIASVVRSVTRVPPKIVYAAAASSALQPRHLRFESQVRTDLDRAAPSRPIEVGVVQTWHAMLRGFAAGAFA